MARLLLPVHRSLWLVAVLLPTALLAACGPNWPQEHQDALAAASARLADGDAAGAVEHAERAIEIGRYQLSDQSRFLCEALRVAADATERANNLPAAISHLQGVLVACDDLTVHDRLGIDVRLLDLFERAELFDDRIGHLAGVVATGEYRSIAGAERMSILACELGFLRVMGGAIEPAAAAFGMAADLTGGVPADECDEYLILALVHLDLEGPRDAFLRLFAIAAVQPAVLSMLVQLEPNAFMQGAEWLYDAGETAMVLDAWRSLVGAGGRLPPDSPAAAMVAREVFRVLVQQDPLSREVVGVWRWMPALLLSAVARSDARPQLLRAWQLSTADASAVAAYATALHGAFSDGSVVFRANALDNPFFWQIAIADAQARLGRHRDAIRSLGDIDEARILSWDPAQQDFDRWLGFIPGILDLCMDKVDCGEIHAAGRRLVAATMAVLDRRAMQPAGTMPAKVAELTALLTIAVRIGDIPAGVRILDRIMELRRAAGATDADLLALRRWHASLRFDQILADMDFDLEDPGQHSLVDQLAFGMRFGEALGDLSKALSDLPTDGVSQALLAFGLMANADLPVRLQRALRYQWWPEAYEVSVQMRQMSRGTYGPGSLIEAMGLGQHALIAGKLGRRDEAARLRREGYDMIEGMLGPFSMVLVISLREEADAHEADGRRREAGELRVLARAIQACRRSWR